MVELWEIGLEGETRLERAMEYAGKTKEPEPLYKCLTDESYHLDDYDRLLLALFISDYVRGKAWRGRGRLKDDETPWPQQIQERDKRRERNRNIDRAERLYRYIIFRRRRYRGAPVRGARSELIPRIAGLCKIDPRQLRSRLHK